MGAPYPWDPFPPGILPAGCSTTRKSSLENLQDGANPPGFCQGPWFCRIGAIPWDGERGNGQIPPVSMGTAAHQGPAPTGRAARSSVSADIWGREPPVTCHSSASPGRAARPESCRINLPDKPSDPRLWGSRRHHGSLGRAGDTCGSSPGDTRPGAPRVVGMLHLGFSRENLVLESSNPPAPTYKTLQSPQDGAGNPKMVLQSPRWIWEP